MRFCKRGREGNNLLLSSHPCRHIIFFFVRLLGSLLATAEGGASQHRADKEMPSEHVTVRSTHVVPAPVSAAPPEDDILTSEGRGRKGDALRWLLFGDARARATLEAIRWYLIISAAAYDSRRAAAACISAFGIYLGDLLHFCARQA